LTYHHIIDNKPVIFISLMPVKTREIEVARRQFLNHALKTNELARSFHYIDENKPVELYFPPEVGENTIFSIILQKSNAVRAFS